MYIFFKSTIAQTTKSLLSFYLTCLDHNELWKILKEMGIPDQLTCLLRNLMQVRKHQLELDMEQQSGSK